MDEKKNYLKTKIYALNTSYILRIPLAIYNNFLKNFESFYCYEDNGNLYFTTRFPLKLFRVRKYLNYFKGFTLPTRFKKKISKRNYVIWEMVNGKIVGRVYVSCDGYEKNVFNIIFDI